MRNNYKPHKYSDRYHDFFKRLLAVPMIKKFNTEFIDPDDVQQIEPPYIITANHVNFWDPFWLNIVPKGRIRYIVSDHSWRNPLRRFFLNRVGAIPKAKSTSDIRTIKGILNVIKQKGVIGLFPEGIRSWDGTTLNMFFSAAKLIKKLKIPLITCKIQGGFYSRPRWTKKHHIGKVIIELRLAATAEQIKEMSEQQIYDRLTELTRHDEVAFQDKAQISYKGKHKALNMEYALFTCPHCKQIGELQGKGNKFFCRSCGNTIKVNDKWYFEADSDKDVLLFNNIRDWYDWQVADLFSRIETHNKTNKDAYFMDDIGATLMSENKKEKMLTLLKGTAFLDQHAVTVKNEKTEMKIPLKDIKALNVQDNEELEFKIDGVTHGLYFSRPVSAVKWKKAINHFKQIQGIAEPPQVTGF